MSSAGVIGYLFAGTAFLVLSVVILIKWRHQGAAVFYLFAAITTSVWAYAVAYTLYFRHAVTVPVVMLELARNVMWSILLARVIESVNGGSMPTSRALYFVVRASYMVPVFLAAVLLVISTGDHPPTSWIGFDLRIILHIVMALLGLLLVEQLFVVAGSEFRWSVKFVCFAFAGFYAYDFYLYSDALFFDQMDMANWDARGFIVAFIVPVIGVGISRGISYNTRLNLSRQAVFYSFSLFLAGGYLIITAAGGYYFRQFGGDWGGVAANTFIFTALVFLLALLSSGKLRSQLRVTIDKHFLTYKYDYREEWLRLIRNLSNETDISGLQEKAVTVLCDIVDSPAGSLWIRKNADVFVQTEIRGFPAVSDVERANDSLVKFLEKWQWVINVDEYTQDAVLYEGLVLPSWLKSNTEAWLVIPLMLQTQLYGFVVVARPRAERDFNWEDIDLLKTAGRQVAIHLAQAQSAEALAQSRQFEAFNRLSAFVIHDLKNLMSQLGLVVKNAEKHRTNPAFVDDAIRTVDNSVHRMNRLLAQLKTGMVLSSDIRRVDIRSVINQVQSDKKTGKPTPSIEIKQENITVCADFDRLVSVIGHVVQNAQDASPVDGDVKIIVEKDDEFAIVHVIDHGCGMDAVFIKERLFKPFDSTKGLAGMGIGAHDVKQFIEGIGGRVDVVSRVGDGTAFTLWIPLCY